jgi:hypothetical protein
VQTKAGSLRLGVPSNLDSSVLILLIPEKIEAPRGGYPIAERALPPLMQQALDSVQGLDRLVVGEADSEPVESSEDLTMMTP